MHWLRRIDLRGLLIVVVSLTLLAIVGEFYQDHHKTRSEPGNSEAFFFPVDFRIHPGDLVPVCVRTRHTYHPSQVTFTVSSGRIVSHIGNSPSAGFPQFAPRIWCWIFQGDRPSHVTVNFWLDGKKIARQTLTVTARTAVI